MFLAKVSIKRPVMATMGIMVFLIFGILAFISLNLDLMPDVKIPYVTVQTVYPGAGPKEIETLISKRIEDAVSTVSQIERVESYSLDGVSIVIIEFKSSKDVDVANQEVKDKVDQIINVLPTDAMKPIVQKVDFRAFAIVDVVLSGDLDPRQLYEIADKTLKDRFSQISGVANVNITGGQEREVRVVLDNRLVYENMISLPQLMQTLALNNMDIPGGYFKIGDQEYTVRLKGQFDNVETMKELQVPTAFGPKKLSQFADVQDAGKDIRQRSVYYDLKNDFRNENVVRLGIVKSPEGNVVDVADAIKQALPEIRSTLPEGVNIEIINDRSEFVRSTVEDTMSNIILGVLFTSLVLLIFLANIRSTFIVALTMPISIISTFLLLQVAGLTLNMMTLMGLSVSVGVLVANSVVVLENIFRHKHLGLNNKDASYVGTTEVMVAVLASTLTNLVVFLPIAAMTSIVGQFLRELALAASFATIFSLIYSFTLTPMLSSLILPKAEFTSKLGQKINEFYKTWDEYYRRQLIGVLKSKKRSLILIVGSFVLFILSAIYYGPKLGFEFMPQFDDGKVKIEVELPEGYNLNETASVLKSIEDKVKGHEEVEYLLTDLGKKSNLDIGTNMARMDVQLIDVFERNISLREIIAVFVKELSDVPNAKIVVDYASTMGAGGAPIQLFLLGQDLDKLEELKVSAMNELQGVPGLINLDQSSRSGKPEITVFPKREV
ncbi:MAG: acriflavin resistance protein, partial [Ignavibacteria bacterium RBG_13_36_8]